MLTVHNAGDSDFKVDPQPGLRLVAKGLSVSVVARTVDPNGLEIVLLIEAGRRSWQTLAEWRKWWSRNQSPNRV